MDEQLIDLGRRLVALPGFRWMPGMLRDDGWRFFGLDRSNGEEHGFVRAADGGSVAYSWPLHLREVRAIPDLSDPATLGCLLALVREVWKAPSLYTINNGGGDVDSSSWEAIIDPNHYYEFAGQGDTEAGALVDALERAGLEVQDG